jgi:hypothetical protein
LKHLAAASTAETPADPRECLELLRAIEQYPSWYSHAVREVEVRERDGDGRPSRAHVVLHVSIGPFHKDLPFDLAVSQPAEDAISLVRIPMDPGDQERFVAEWRVEPGPPTKLRIELDADLAVPRLVPTAGVGEALAQGLVRAAVAEIGRRRDEH